MAMLSRRRSLVCSLATSGACSVTVAPIDVAAGCPAEPPRTAAPRETAGGSDLIDDFEHEGNSLPRRGGRDGMWALLSDGSADTLEAGVSDHCAARGQRAGHFAGNGLSGWGAHWTALLRRQSGGPAVPFDATAHGGISFWAALGSEVPAPFSLQVGVTTPAPDVSAGGVGCATCMGYYASDISLDHTWRRFELRFRELVQADNGNPPAPLRLDTVVGLTFWPTEDVEIWLDDVRFEP
jgi:hypothetical protein